MLIVCIKVSRVFYGFSLAAFEAGGHRPQPQGLRTSKSRKALMLGVKTGGVARRASNEASGFCSFYLNSLVYSFTKNLVN